MEGRERLVVQKSSLSMHILLLLAWIGEAEERERGRWGNLFREKEGRRRVCWFSPGGLFPLGT